MAKLTIIRLSQSPNQYGSFSYRVTEGTPEENTKLYGENNDIIYCNQKAGVWNTPTEVEQFLGKSKNSGKNLHGLLHRQGTQQFPSARTYSYFGCKEWSEYGKDKNAENVGTVRRTGIKSLGHAKTA